MFGRTCPLVVPVGRKMAKSEDLGGFQVAAAKPIPTHSKRVSRKAFFSSLAKRVYLRVPPEL